MPFGNISTFYLPTAANAGASLWGTDVRRLVTFIDPPSDATSKTNHSTGGAVTRTVDPYTTTTTDDVQANFGWAIAPTDMGSVAGAKRFMLAGDHVATVRMGHNGATAVTGTLFLFAYRVAAGTRARTLLGSDSASFNLPINAGEVTASVALTLPEIIFEPDETIQYSYEVSCAGIALVGRILTFYTGTQAGVAARMDTPTLGVLADTTGSATGLGLATGTTGKVLGSVGSAAGIGTGIATGASTAETIGSAIGAGTAAGMTSAVAGTTGAATGTGTAAGILTGIGSMIGSATGSGFATGVLGATGGMTGLATGLGAASGVLGATGGMVGTAAGLGSASAQASSVAGSVGTASGFGTAAGVMSSVLGTVGTVGTGDWPLNEPTKSISGVTRSSAGGVVESAIVKLFRQSDDLLVATTTSDSTTGAYSFERGADDPHSYFVLAYREGAPEIHGVTDRGLVPA